MDAQTILLTFRTAKVRPSRGLRILLRAGGGLLAGLALWGALAASPAFRSSERAFLARHPQESPAQLRAVFRLSAAGVLGGLASSLVLGRRLWGRRGSGPYGEASFHDLEEEFGDRRGAVAALLVRRPVGPASERGFVGREGARRRLAFVTWEQLSRHVLVVGNTGSGKTTGVFNHLMLSSEVPWIYQDQKAELPLRGRFPDRPVWGLDVRGRATRSAVWNPLDEVRSSEEVEVLAALLLPDRGDEYDWVVRSARHLFEALLVATSAPSLQALAALLERQPPEALSAALPAGARAALTNPRQRGYFIQAILEALRPWTTPRASRISAGESTVRLDDFVARGGYVLCNEDPSLRAPVTLFWGLLLHRLRNRSGAADRLVLLLDEFGDAGRVPNMASALALYRSKNVALVAGVQSYALMRTVYREEWEAVRDGFGILLALTANLPDDMREILSRQLGHRSLHQPTLNLGRGGPSVGFGTRIAADLVPVDRWGDWGRGHACLARGHHPTWWVPEAVPLDAAPLGPPDAPSLWAAGPGLHALWSP